MNKKILYISYDGMTDPLGEGQVINYLIGLFALVGVPSKIKRLCWC